MFLQQQPLFYMNSAKNENIKKQSGFVYKAALFWLVGLVLIAFNRGDNIAKGYPVVNLRV